MHKRGEERADQMRRMVVEPGGAGGECADAATCQLATVGGSSGEAAVAGAVGVVRLMAVATRCVVTNGAAERMSVRQHECDCMRDIAPHWRAMRRQQACSAGVNCDSGARHAIAGSPRRTAMRRPAAMWRKPRISCSLRRGDRRLQTRPAVGSAVRLQHRYFNSIAGSPVLRIAWFSAATSFAFISFQAASCCSSVALFSASAARACAVGPTSAESTEP